MLLTLPEASCGSHLRQDTFLEVLLTQAGEDASRAQEAGFGVTGSGQPFRAFWAPLPRPPGRQLSRARPLCRGRSSARPKPLARSVLLCRRRRVSTQDIERLRVVGRLPDGALCLVPEADEGQLWRERERKNRGQLLLRTGTRRRVSGARPGSGARWRKRRRSPTLARRAEKGRKGAEKSGARRAHPRALAP